MGTVDRAVALAAVAFASTNIDDIFVLIGFFSNREMRRAPIILGQYAGFTTLTVASLACSLFAVAIPESYIRFLGILQISIGAWRFMRARRSADDESASLASGAFFSVASVTVANGADNIAIYVPLFGRQPAETIVITGAVFAAMTGLWCGALWLVSRPTLGAPIRQWRDRLMPLVLIALGAFVLAS
jgi:cadmium resistance protein CadD (predicted permease)